MDPFLNLGEGALVSFFPSALSSAHQYSGRPLASTLLLLLSPPPPPPPLPSLQLGRLCQHRVILGRPSQIPPKIFHPAANVEFYPSDAAATLHCTALHCTIQWDPLEGREGSSSYQTEYKGGIRGLPLNLGSGRPLFLLPGLLRFDPNHLPPRIERQTPQAKSCQCKVCLAYGRCTVWLVHAL